MAISLLLIKTGILTSGYAFTGSSRAVFGVAFDVVLSPVVMTLIFIVRRRLVAQIALVVFPIDYQMV